MGQVPDSIEPALKLIPLSKMEQENKNPAVSADNASISDDDSPELLDWWLESSDVKIRRFSLRT